MRLLFPLILFPLILSSACFAQEVTAPPLPDGEKWEHYSDARLSEKIIILLDVSASMDTQKSFTEAMSKISLMVNLEIENAQILLITFAREHTVFTHSDGNPWFELPDKTERIKELHYFIQNAGTTRFHGGITTPVSAFAAAETLADNKTCILLVSDGKFAQEETVLNTIAGIQAHHKNKSGHVLPVFCYGIGQRETSLVHLAGRYCGWYILRELKPEPVYQDPLPPFHWMPR